MTVLTGEVFFEQLFSRTHF